MQKKQGFLDALYQALGSLKLGVFIFLTLAALSLFGTLMPQGMTEHEIQSQFSPGTAWWIKTLGLNDLYHTGWFQLVLLLLCVNLIVCSIQRLPKKLKLLQHKDEHISAQKLVKFGYHRQMTTRLPFEEVKARLARTVSEEFASLQNTEADTPEAYADIAEKGRWSPLMVYVVHLSILLILFGALAGSLWGFKGVMQISEGAASNQVMLYSGEQAVALPFEVRCNEFEVSFYDNGTPKEFRSDLVIVEGEREVLKQSIRVNDPLTYEGITFYQSSYGSTLKSARLELLDRDSGRVIDLNMPFRETGDIPGTKDRIQIMEYQQNLSRFGPAVAVMIMREGEQEPAGSWILANMPDFHGNRVLNYQIKVTGMEQAEYTGLQVKRDPGIWPVYIGFIIMLVGIGVSYYSSHRKIWIWAAPTGNSTRIVLAGRPSKSPFAFEQEFERLCGRLDEELNRSER